MGRFNESLKVWSPPIAVVCAVILASGYVLSERSEVVAQIGALRQLGAELNEAALRTQGGAMAPQQAQTLHSMRADLGKRMDESLKPGLVQAQLMASAREAGLDVREVQPVGGPTAPGSADAKSIYRHYRVLVRGRYSQIAEYMELCKRQRVPTRPTEFRVTGIKDAQPAEASLLQAEITMEAFATQAKLKQAGSESSGT